MSIFRDKSDYIFNFFFPFFPSLNPTDFKSRYDEEKSLREAADQRLAKLNEQLREAKEENERLQTELVQQHAPRIFCYLFCSLE